MRFCLTIDCGNTWARIKELTVTTIFGRFNIAVVVASAGLWGAAIALSADAAAAPLITGGAACVQGMAPAAAGGPLDAGVCTAGAAAPELGGVPLAVPGPVPVGAPVPLAPVAPVVPAGMPLIALGPAGALPVDPVAPVIDMSGNGKGAPTGPPPPGGPVPGQPIPAGPSAAGAS
jgi:hypothetical protein